MQHHVISFSSDGSHKDYLNVHYECVCSARINISKTELCVGEHADVIFEYDSDTESFDYLWKSSDESVVSVINSTEIKATGSGDAEISLYINGKVACNKKIVVKNYVVVKEK